MLAAANHWVRAARSLPRARHSSLPCGDRLESGRVQFQSSISAPSTYLSLSLQPFCLLQPVVARARARADGHRRGQQFRDASRCIPQRRGGKKEILPAKFYLQKIEGCALFFGTGPACLATLSRCESLAPHPRSPLTRPTMPMFNPTSAQTQATTRCRSRCERTWSGW